MGGRNPGCGQQRDLPVRGAGYVLSGTLNNNRDGSATFTSLCLEKCVRPFVRSGRSKSVRTWSLLCEPR